MAGGGQARGGGQREEGASHQGWNTLTGMHYRLLAMHALLSLSYVLRGVYITNSTINFFVSKARLGIALGCPWPPQMCDCHACHVSNQTCMGKTALAT